MNDGIDGRQFTNAPEGEKDGLAELADLAEQLVLAEKEAEKRRKALKAAENAVVLLAEKEIPQLIEELGMPIPPEGLKIPTRRGFSIVVKESVKIECPKYRMPALVRWLDENGEAGMVKRQISLAFNREQSEEAARLRDELSGKYPAVESKETVHAQTLGAWVRRRLEAGEEVPDCVSLFFARKATVV